MSPGGLGDWAENVIGTTIVGVTSIQAADVDRDGDLDIVTAAPAYGRITWYVNDGTPGSGSDWVENVVTDTATQVFSVLLHHRREHLVACVEAEFEE